MDVLFAFVILITIAVVIVVAVIMLTGNGHGSDEGKGHGDGTDSSPPSRMAGALVRLLSWRHGGRPAGDEMLERSIELGEPESPTGAPVAEEPQAMRFTVYHPQELIPEAWAKLLAYIHVAGADASVTQHSQALLAGESTVHGRLSDAPSVAIAREASIRVVPELDGCRFNPPEATVLWLEDWHCAEFRVQAHAGSAGYRLGAVNGRVAFYVESVLVGEVPIWAVINATASLAQPAPAPAAKADPYDKIFVSYSRRDKSVVQTLERAYKALGDRILRDEDTLRSGENWLHRLYELVDEASVFQLYWSAQSAQSRYVTEEWRHALSLSRDRFIRPLYWQEPIAPVPDELRALHFAFVPDVVADDDE